MNSTHDDPYLHTSRQHAAMLCMSLDGLYDSILSFLQSIPDILDIRSGRHDELWKVVEFLGCRLSDLGERHSGIVPVQSLSIKLAQRKVRL